MTKIPLSPVFEEFCLFAAGFSALWSTSLAQIALSGGLFGSDSQKPYISTLVSVNPMVLKTALP